MTTPLLVVLPVHGGDVDNAEALLRWIAELGNVQTHSLLVAADNALPVDRAKALGDMGRPHFHSVTIISVPTGAKGWPLAANLMFRAVARQIMASFKLPFLWCEADAVPLKASWLDDIAEAYRLCPKPFMGALLDNDVALENLPRRYMAGVGVYPQDTFGVLNDLWKDAKFTGPSKPGMHPNAVTSGVGAWDMTGAHIVVPRAKNTPLISHFWGTSYSGGGVPIYRASRTEADPPNTVLLDAIPKDAVLRHRIKDVAGFVDMWRVRLEAAKPELATPGGVVPLAGHLPETQPGPANANWRGGSSPEADKERRRAKAEESKAYLAESRRIAAERRSGAKQAEPASV